MTKITARSCGGKVTQDKCGNSGFHTPSWYGGNFNAGLPSFEDLNFGDCVSLGWEQLPDGSFRLRAEYRPGCVDKLLNGNINLRYDEDFHKGQCPGVNPISGDVYRCVDRFGTALIKTGLFNTYYLGFDKKCVGPFQSVIDLTCPLNQWGVITNTWFEIPKTFSSIDNCNNLSSNNICKNEWTVLSEVVQPGALVNDSNVAPQGPCVGLEPNVTLIKYEPPSSCGGFIPCGRVITYKCDKVNCYLLTEDLERITTENGDLLLWCNETNNSTYFQVGAVSLNMGSEPGGINSGTGTQTDTVSTTIGAESGVISFETEIQVASTTIGAESGVISIEAGTDIASTTIGAEPGVVNSETGSQTNIASTTIGAESGVII